MTTKFYMELDVDDKRALYNHALHHAKTVDGMAHGAAVELLKPGGEVDVSVCLVMALDPGSLPGVSIHQSGVED